MVFAIAYGAGATALSVLLALIFLGRRPEGSGWHIVLACAITLLWTVACAIEDPRLAGPTQLLENARSVGWLYFLAALLGAAKRSAGASGTQYIGVSALALGALALGNDLRFLGAAASVGNLDFSQVFARVALAVAGILLVENLYRNTGAERRWHVVPLCIGIGGMFAYDLFLYSDALLFRRVDVALFAARGFVIALTVPALVLTMVRNRDWRIDVHVSRQVVFHTATLIASGIFLLAAAAAALILRRLPGDWGTLLEAVILFGSVMVLVTVLSSGTVRSRIKALLEQNLFSHRYDYRLEWMKFVETVSSANDLDGLQVRVIRAMADIVDSPGGALWLRTDGGAYRPSHQWSLHYDPAVSEPEQSSFIAGFANGTAIQELRDARGAIPAEAGTAPGWARTGPAVWLAVPLWHRDGLLGFATLLLPRAPTALNWESRDLLIAVGKQAASYLSEEEIARSLFDAKLLTAYSRRFAFVVHDIKNLVSQLSMTVANARAHGHDPEFQRDMLVTLENSVSRMNELLSKLRAGEATGGDQGPFDPREIIASVANEVGHRRVTVLTERDERAARVAIKPGALRSALTHLITNALEASKPGQPVIVRSRVAGERVMIEVEDQGPGMDADFIREELFRPLRSTKSGGYGIGAFQTRETIRDAGGELQVTSTPGKGTTMRILLPCVWEGRSEDQTVGAVGG